MHKLFVTTLLLVTAALPAFSQADVKASVLKHLQTAEDFTVKVAEAMPEGDYAFKLTAPQMSFGEQLVHLGNALNFILSPISGGKGSESEAKPTGKGAIIQFVRSSYERAISDVSALTPDQLSKNYSFEGHPATGLDLLLAALDHSTQHRASAEMYLRAKGITPPRYEF